MASDGWIKLHRKSIESRVFSDASLWRLWTWCLLRANHTTGYFDGHEIQPGSFATGTRVAGETLGLSPSTVHRGLKRLAEWGMLSLKVKRTYTIVTICNYKAYQDSDGPTETQKKHRRNAGATLVTHACNADETLVQPIEEEQEQQEGKNNKKGSAPPLDLPPVLDSPEFRSVLDKWRAYKGRAYKPRGLQSLLTQAEKRADAFGLQAVINAFETAMSNDHEGWNFESNFRSNGNGRQRNIGPGQRFDKAAAESKPGVLGF